MLTDLVLSPFDAEMGDVLAAARVADAGGFDGVWTYDHFSATMFGRTWSLHPFTALGAIAAVTDRVRIGCLVANMVNRHPTQVASALGTLSSLAPGRVVCGIGAGAGPGSMYAGEQDMIGRRLQPASSRRAELVEYIAALRAVWSGTDLDGERVTLRSPSGIVPPGPPPPVVVGATTRATALVAAEHADGVNLHRRDDLAETVDAVRAAVGGRDFEVSLNADLDLDHPLGGDPSEVAALGITRRTLAIRAPYPLDRVAEIAANLAREGR